MVVVDVLITTISYTLCSVAILVLIKHIFKRDTIIAYMFMFVKMSLIYDDTWKLKGN